MLDRREKHDFVRSASKAPVFGAAIVILGILGISAVVKFNDHEPGANTASPEPSVAIEENSVTDFASRSLAISVQPGSLQPSESDVANRLGVLARSDAEVERFELLHTQQRLEIARMNDDLGAVAAGSNGQAGGAITVGEIRDFHAQQKLALAAVDDGELAVPAVLGSQVLTVAEVKARHESQEQVLSVSAEGSEAIDFGANSGELRRTVAEIRALHEQQHAALERISGSAYPVMIGGGDATYQTVDQIRLLHERQSEN